MTTDLGRQVKDRFFRGLILLLAGFAVSCGEEASVGVPTPSSGHEPDQILTDTRIIISENGKTTAILEAHIVKIFEDSSYTSLEDSLTIFFYNREGEHTTTLTAQNGEVWGLYENVDSLRASGDVRIVSEERSAWLNAPGIRWIASAGRVIGDGLVRINSENGYEEGTGFEAKDDLSEYEFTGPVSGEVRGEDIKLMDR